MSLRRALWASPLAALIAVLAHFLTFGVAHAPGAGHALPLLGTVAAALAFALAWAFGSGFFARASRDQAPEQFGHAALLLAAAGAAAFGLIELSEGHLALRALLTATVAAVPLASLVLFGARCAGRVARRVGISCAAFASRIGRLAHRSTATFIGALRPEPSTSACALGSLRGRAPPLSF